MACSNCDFTRDYALGRAAVMREIEQCVLGSDYGGTSWTTRAQAQRLALRLDLRPGVRLLDVGGGAGWPALWLAQTTGCDVVVTDVPVLAMQIARERAERDGVGARCAAVAADASALPFPAGSFDRLNHCDVLCCLPAKLDVLRECRRVARPEATMAFSVLSVSPGLADDEHRFALDAGPPFVDAPADYADLLRDTGWNLVQREDLTAEHLACARVLIQESMARRDALVELLGADEAAERVQRRRKAVAALERGVLRRELFVAVAEPVRTALR
jgi:SAM-dependent methyltransferase